MGVAFFFGVFLLVLSDDAEGDWSACRNLHLLPNVQVPFCQFQHIFFLGPAEGELPLLFPLMNLDFRFCLSYLSSWHHRPSENDCKTFVTFVASSFIEEVVAENLLLVNR